MTALSSKAQVQRFRALDRANDSRFRRAELKQELRDGSRLLSEVLSEPEYWLFSAPIWEVLSWCPRLGAVKVNTLLRRAEVWPLKPIGSLTSRQRMRLVGELASMIGDK